MNGDGAGRLGTEVTVEKLLRAGLVLGRKDGYSFGESLDRSVAAAGTQSLSLTAEIPQIVRLVALGRLDFTILGEEEAEYVLRNGKGLEGATLVRLSAAPPGNLRYFMYSKKIDASIRLRIDEAIARIVDSPAYLRIEARYGLGS